jgi:UDP-N-acetylglucosamine transferase subunit ALG13
MILVATGTTAWPFDRLVRAVERFELDESIVVQHGASSIRPAGTTCLDYVSFERFVELVQEARIVVTHAGVGSILVALMNGKRPWVVPRRACFGEAVDDHQLELGRRLSNLGALTLVEDPSKLSEALASVPVLEGLPLSGEAGSLVPDLRAYLEAVVNGRPDGERCLA